MTATSSPPGTAAAPAGEVPGEADDRSTATGPTLRSGVRTARGPVLVVLALVVASAVLAVLSLRPSGELDPDAYDPAGSRAVAELLRDRGVEVAKVGTVEQVRERAGGATVTVLPFPAGLAAAELEELGGLPGGLVVVAPDDDALTALDLSARTTGQAPVEGRRPSCDHPPAARAGDADLGGTSYAPTGGAQAVGCYATGGEATLLVLPARDAVLLGTGAPLTNDRLDERGNAALALGLFDGAQSVSWLVPDAGREVPAGEQRPLTDLLPSWLLLGLVQVGVAVVLLALWRGRRLGRVVEEPLPVVVRAAEAVEGRGRLYRAAGARGAAAEALRAGVRERVATRLGLAPGDRPGLITQAAARAGGDPAGVDALLYGSPPPDDVGLVRLADALRALERALTDPPGPTGRPAPSRPPSSPDSPDRGADQP